MLTLKIWHGDDNKTAYFGGLHRVEVLGIVRSREELKEKPRDAVLPMPSAQEVLEDLARMNDEAHSIVRTHAGTRYNGYSPFTDFTRPTRISVLCVWAGYEKDPEYLVVESGRVFLMGSDGKTLDKI